MSSSLHSDQISMEHFPAPTTGGLMRALPPTLRREIDAIGAIVRYAPDRMIHQRGDKKPGLSIVVSGAVLISVTNMHGRRITATRFGPGDCFGEFTLFADLPRTHDATAITETRINQISKAQFFSLLDREPALRDYLLRHLSRTLAFAADLLDDERRLPLKTRLAKMLLQFSTRHKTETILTATQSDLADNFGVSRVAMSAALSALRDLGFVETGYGEIKILTPDALGEWIYRETGLEPLAPAK